MPQYMYVLKPVRPGMLAEGPTPAEERIVGEHFAHLQALVARGVVHLAARTLTTGPETMGICILTAADEAAARGYVQSDPAVAENVMTAELFPCRVALWGREPA
ncbi:MAG TPA: YciI family protein [Candidatus Krumholzibacteria bacterium]|nr:YciI family protein [Candidatus Krumholzibacteria bacterium]